MEAAEAECRAGEAWEMTVKEVKAASDLEVNNKASTSRQAVVVATTIDEAMGTIFPPFRYAPFHRFTSPC